MRGFWQGVMIGGITGMVLGLMTAPRLGEEMGLPLRKRGEQLGSMAQRAMRGVQENVGDMWKRRMEES